MVPGGCRAHGALAVESLDPGVNGLALVVEHALAVGAGLPGVLAGVVPGGGLGEYPRIDGAGGALRTGGEATVVPAGGVSFRGVELAQTVPAVEGVLR